MTQGIFWLTPESLGRRHQESPYTSSFFRARTFLELKHNNNSQVIPNFLPPDTFSFFLSIFGISESETTSRIPTLIITCIRIWTSYLISLSQGICLSQMRIIYLMELLYVWYLISDQQMLDIITRNNSNLCDGLGSVGCWQLSWHLNIMWCGLERWLRVLNALSEDSRSVSSTRARHLTITSTPAPEDPMSSFGLCRHPHVHVCTHNTCRDTQLYTHFKKKLIKRVPFLEFLPQLLIIMI